MRFPAPLLRPLAALLDLAPAMAKAVTLEQYFFGFSDRDRGVYITGVLDLFAADSSRDPDYRHCVGEIGAAGMHEAISEIVREDPRLLSFDASLWILYEASRRCNTSAGGPPVPDPRSMLTAIPEETSKDPGVPDLATAPAEGPGQVHPGSELDWPWRDWRYIAGGSTVLLLLLAGLVTLLRRRRHGRRRGSRAPQGGSPTVRRQTPSSHHG